MFKFVLNKMLNKKWMVLSLLIGNILLISIACVNPMYTQAVLQRMLTRNLAQYMEENNRYPGTLTISAVTSVRDGKVLNQADFDGARDNYLHAAEWYDVPAVEGVEHYYVSNVNAKYDVPRSEKNNSLSMQLGRMSDIAAHSALVGGRMFSDTRDSDGTIEVIASQSAMAKLDLLLDETITLKTITDASGNPVRLKIVGVFKNSDASDIYWVRSPGAYSNELFMADGIFDELFASRTDTAYQINAVWYRMLDYEQMRGDCAQQMYDLTIKLKEQFGDSYSFRFTAAFENTLANYIVRANQVNTTLWVLQVPILVLLCAFIFMVSRQMLQLEQGEISILKSRGAARRQIITVYLIQSLGISLISFIIALPLSAWLCQVLGSANAFLEFVRRKALVIEFSPEVFIFGAAAAVFSICVMVFPVMRYANVSIVAHKQRKNRKSEKPFWQKIYLDFVLLGVSLYGLYSFNNQKDLLAQRVLDGASLDPLLFLCSSLFIIGAGLVALRIIPIIIWLIFTAFKRLWSPGLYASFLRVLRTRSSQGFIMVFLMLTVALGIFNAQTARTVNTNAEEQVEYMAGADLVMQEKWQDNSQSMSDSSASSDVNYIEPDFGKYMNIDGVESVTRVYQSYDGTATTGGKTIKNVHVMGINTKEFGETAWFKPSLLSHHWYEYLNAMAQNSRALLVSSNFRDLHGLKIGDVITYKPASSGSESLRGIIYGFVDYWPTHAPVVQQKGNDGLYSESPNYLVVGNLSQIQASCGVKPYQIWMKVNGSTSFMYDYIAEHNIEMTSFADTSEALVEKKNDPMFQGTNGILTVGFIVVLLLCTTGFLIYWILSIQSRSLQFGIFRAMGMSLREILSMLINEQIFISGTSIATGAAIGILASKLYIPLIQLAYAASDNVLPLSIITDQSDFAKLFSVIGIVMLICMVILGVIISRIKIAQALKLGED